MNVRAKFDGGKQINRSQSGSWQARCAGAGLRMNEGPSWGPKAWEKITSTLPSKTFKSVAVEKEQTINANRKRKSTIPVKAKRKRAKLAKQSESQKGRRDYSRYDGGSNTYDVITDIIPENLYTLMKDFYQPKVEISEVISEGIKLKTVVQGNSNHFQVWLAERRKRLTASNVGSIVKRKQKQK